MRGIVPCGARCRTLPPSSKGEVPGEAPDKNECREYQQTRSTGAPFGVKVLEEPHQC